MSDKLKGWFGYQREGFAILDPGTVIWLISTNQTGVKYRVGPFADDAEADMWCNDPIGFLKALIATGDRSFSITPIVPILEPSATRQELSSELVTTEKVTG